jgi:mannose-6-phosphate isomerase-like protein (cupin superfamily)
MTRQPHNEPEAALRRLAFSIIDAIQSKADILQNQLIEVPELDDAAFEQPCLDEAGPLPRAYRFVEDIVSSDQGPLCRKLLEQFHAVEEQLIWGQAPGYDIDNVGQEFLNNYCHALLTGPDGPLKCTSPLGAFVLFGPNTLYKDHSHAPNEVYLAITGGGQWRVGSHGWRQLEAGETIFIPSETVHAIRTNTEPLLTFSFWLEPGDMNAIAI